MNGLVRTTDGAMPGRPGIGGGGGMGSEGETVVVAESPVDGKDVEATLGGEAEAQLAFL